MRGAYARKRWVVPAAAAATVVCVFVITVVASSRVRPYWPILVLAAVAAALPFLIRDSPMGRQRPLPLHRAYATDGATSAVPSLRASAISLPKSTAAVGENDDAFGVDLDSGYVAVADGASSSFRAAEWARQLCAAFIHQRSLAAMPSTSWITKATASFRESAQQIAGEDADWWSSEAAGRGAHAAFVGMAILREEERLSWRATAVGDSVLVHLRAPAAGQTPIVTSFPLTHSAAFPQNPTLLSSVAERQPPVTYIDGASQIGDVFLLMTDELARWALRRHEEGEPAWTLLAHGTEAKLADVVAAARATHTVADDDMTIVRCEVVDAG